MINDYLPLISVLVTVFIAAYTMRKANQFFSTRPAWLDETINSFFKEDENGVSAFDGLAQRLGQGFRMSLLGKKSGEVRHQKMIETRVFDAAVKNSPELKLGMAALERLGLGDLATPENLPALFQVAQKYNLLELFGIKGMAGKESSTYSW